MLLINILGILTQFKMLLKKKDFLNILKLTPLCSIDMLIKIKGRYLFGLRNNMPAANYYFVPGGRILKNEKYQDAIKRILKNEIGLSINNLKYSIIGIFDHLYKENCFNIKGINTHYFVCAIKIDLKKKINLKKDSQHSQFVFLKKKNALENKKVHKFSKSYLRIVK